MIEWTVAIICALSIETSAMTQMYDEDPKLREVLAPSDDNLYRGGKIKDHDVLLLSLSDIGTLSAAGAIENLKRSFPSVRFALMVGIAGGIPAQKHDIRLGDVVVSKPEGDHGGVIYYDFGKVTDQGFQRTGHLNKPPQQLRSSINKLQQKDEEFGLEFPSFLNRVTQRMKDRGFCKPETPDVLYQLGSVVHRDARPSSDPTVFYGLIASGNKVVKSESFRNGLVCQRDPVRCVEMEAAGIMDRMDCLVIRGVSDYADGHKDDNYQKYAALTAAALARELLCDMPPQVVLSMKSISGSPMPYTSPQSSPPGPAHTASYSSDKSFRPSAASPQPSSQDLRFGSPSVPQGIFYVTPQASPSIDSQSVLSDPMSTLSMHSARSCPVYATCETCENDLPSDKAEHCGERVAVWCSVHHEIFDLECGIKRHGSIARYKCHLFYVRGFRDSGRTDATRCNGPKYMFHREKHPNQFLGVSCEECGEYNLCEECLEARHHKGLEKMQCKSTGKMHEWTFYLGTKNSIRRRMIKTAATV